MKLPLVRALYESLSNLTIKLVKFVKFNLFNLRPECTSHNMMKVVREFIRRNKGVLHSIGLGFGFEHSDGYPS